MTHEGLARPGPCHLMSFLYARTHRGHDHLAIALSTVVGEQQRKLVTSSGLTPGRNQRTPFPLQTPQSCRDGQPRV